MNGIRTKSISLPRLTGLSPTLESTALKLSEETGELARVIGRFRNLSGESNNINEKEIFEEITKELLDVAQVTITMCFVLEEQHGIDIEHMLQQHIEKLQNKGYLGGDNLE